MSGLPNLADVRERSRSARERSSNLRVTSQQLRESMEGLRAYASEVGGGVGDRHKAPFSAEDYAQHVRQTPMDFAALMRQRVQKARAQAQILRRRAADLRQQAAEFRARSENLRGSYSLL